MRFPTRGTLRGDGNDVDRSNNLQHHASLNFEDALRRVRDCVHAAGRAPHHRVTAETLGPGRWLELTARAGGTIIARAGWSLDHFGEDTLETIAEWLELQAAMAERRHLRVIG